MHRHQHLDTHGPRAPRRALNAAAALAIGGATLGGIGTAAASGDDTKSTVLRLYAVANFDAEAYIRANGAPPPTSSDDAAAVGDVTILEDDLFAIKPRTNEPTGEQLGTIRGQCTFISITHPGFDALNADALCTGVLTLPRGTLVVDGIQPIDFTKPAHDVFAITGGTGDYANAHGTVTVNGLPTQDDTEAAAYEIRLTR